MFCFFFSSRRRHTRSLCDWSSDVCSSDLGVLWNVLWGSVPGERLRREWKPDPVYGPTRQSRSEERRVGKECRSRWARYQSNATRERAKRAHPKRDLSARGTRLVTATTHRG